MIKSLALDKKSEAGSVSVFIYTGAMGRKKPPSWPLQYLLLIRSWNKWQHKEQITSCVHCMFSMIPVDCIFGSILCQMIDVWDLVLVQLLGWALQHLWCSDGTNSFFVFRGAKSLFSPFAVQKSLWRISSDSTIKWTIRSEDPVGYTGDPMSKLKCASVTTKTTPTQSA